MNQVTHWLDSSNVYGSDLQTQQAIRWNRSGLLSYSLSVDGQYVLPDDNDEHCRRGTCMLSGLIIDCPLKIDRFGKRIIL